MCTTWIGKRWQREPFLRLTTGREVWGWNSLNIWQFSCWGRTRGKRDFYILQVFCDPLPLDVETSHDWCCCFPVKRLLSIMNGLCQTLCKKKIHDTKFLWFSQLHVIGFLPERIGQVRTKGKILAPSVGSLESSTLFMSWIYFLFQCWWHRHITTHGQSDHRSSDTKWHQLPPSRDTQTHQPEARQPRETSKGRDQSSWGKSDSDLAGLGFRGGTGKNWSLGTTWWVWRLLSFARGISG